MDSLRNLSFWTSTIPCESFDHWDQVSPTHSGTFYPRVQETVPELSGPRGARPVYLGRRSSAGGSPEPPVISPGGQGPNQLSRPPSTVITDPETKSPASEAR